MRDTDLSPASFARRQVSEAADLMASIRRKLICAQTEAERADLQKQLQNARNLLRRLAEAEVYAAGRELYDLHVPASHWQPAKASLAREALEATRAPEPFHRNWRTR